MANKIFSFFSGAGFLDLGFETSGYDIVLANEISKDFVYGYRYAREHMGLPLPKYGLRQEDINIYMPNEKEGLFPCSLDALRGQVDAERADGSLVGFIGGPPCPDFSVAGKNRGAEGKHGVLSQVYMDLICSIRPDFFLFENVKGLWRTAKHKQFFNTLVKQAGEAGYCVTYRLVNSLEYGAPQDRDRILMLGVKREMLPQGEEQNTMMKFPWVDEGMMTLDEIKRKSWPVITPFGGDSCLPEGVLEKLTVEYWFQKNDVANHPNANDYFQPKAALKKMSSIDEGDVSRKAYKRLHRWRYSPTAAYGNNEVHWHPYMQRRISAAEALAIQSLPKSFQLPPDMTLSAKFKTIGNGVPYLLAKSIAERMDSFLSQYVNHA